MQCLFKVRLRSSNFCVVYLVISGVDVKERYLFTANVADRNVSCPELFLGLVLHSPRASTNGSTRFYLLIVEHVVSIGL